MNSNQTLSADEIRLELTRRRLTRRQLSRELNLSYDYVIQILLGYRNAERVRAQISKYLREAS